MSKLYPELAKDLSKICQKKFQNFQKNSNIAKILSINLPKSFQNPEKIYLKFVKKVFKFGNILSKICRNHYQKFVKENPKFARKIIQNLLNLYSKFAKYSSKFSKILFKIRQKVI